MKMKKSLVFGGVAVMALAFAACHKSSSSSSNGSVAAAAEAIMSTAQSASQSPSSGNAAVKPHVTFTQPCSNASSGGKVTPGASTFNLTTVPTTTAQCSSIYQSASSISGGFSLTFTSCTINGYTINGTANMSIPGTGSSPYNKTYYVCDNPTSGLGDTFSGSSTLNATSVSFSGNGINCSSVGTMSATITGSYNGSTLSQSGSMNGTICGQGITSSF